MTQSPASAVTTSWFQCFLTVVERVGKLLPGASTLLAFLTATVVVRSRVFSRMPQ